MKFKVMGGNHSENKKTYEKNDVVTTENDLVKMFGKKKFQRVDEHIVPAEVPEIAKAKEPLVKGKAVTNVATPAKEIKTGKKKIVRRKAK